jgi:hypothetical protein
MKLEFLQNNLETQWDNLHHHSPEVTYVKVKSKDSF